MIITIDGTSGVGKGTLGAGLVEKYGFKFLDTGALFRTVAYAVLQDPDLTEENRELKAIFYSKNLDIEFTPDFRLLMNGKDISKEIRLPETGSMASKIAIIPELRENLKEFCRNFAEKYRSKGVILDGRDAGSQICKNAPVKIFLECPAETRAQRRVEQLKEIGVIGNYDEILKGIQERDYRDSNRKVDPLCAPKGSIKINTAENSIEKVIEIASYHIERQPLYKK